MIYGVSNHEDLRRILPFGLTAVNFKVKHFDFNAIICSYHVMF